MFSYVMVWVIWYILCDMSHISYMYVICGLCFWFMLWVVICRMMCLISWVSIISNVICRLFTLCYKLCVKCHIIHISEFHFG